MTDAQKAELAAVAARKELRGLALKEDSSAEDIEAKTKEVDDLEARSAALSASEPVAEPVKVEPTEDSETRERRELRSKARVSDFVVAALRGQPVTGASGEYADAVGLSGFMPLNLLERESEERAVTPGPDSGTVTTTQPVVPYAFSRTDAAALGITFPMVAPGEAHFPALETAPPAGPKAKDAAAAQTAAAFTLVKRSPTRITGQFLIRLEDLGLLPSMETDLRRGITSATADSLDAQVIGGSGAAPNLSGLFHQATDVAVDGDTETFASAIERFAGVVDGIHANGFSDIYALIGVNTFAKYASVFANADKGDLSAYDVLKSKLGMLRVSTRVPAVAASGQKGVCVLSAQGQAIAVPTWSGDKASAPMQDWSVRRIGANPPAVLPALAESTGMRIAEACGVPGALLDASSDGTSRRESLRFWVHCHVAPLGRIVAAELSDKLDLPGLRFDFAGLYGSDLVGRASAFKRMVEGGMAVEKAAALSGLVAADE